MTSLIQHSSNKFLDDPEQYINQTKDKVKEQGEKFISGVSNIFDQTNKGVQKGSEFVEQFMPERNQQYQDKSDREIKDMYRDTHNKYKQARKSWHSMKRQSDPQYSEMKRQSQDSYNQLKKDQKSLRKEKTRRGWDKFKSGVSKAFNVGKKIISGIGGLFK